MPEALVIRCQRTWSNVVCRNPRLHGGAFSACIAQFERGGTYFAVFVEAHRSVDETTWQWGGTTGGGQGSAPQQELETMTVH